MTAFELPILPASLPPTFSEPFGNLLSWTGAIPISHVDIAHIGFAAAPTAPLPPLIAIDGSDRPARAPGIATEVEGAPIIARSYTSDWNVLHDLLDMSPGMVEVMQLDPMDLTLANDAGWLDNYRSLREMLAFGNELNSARRFFATVFERHGKLSSVHFERAKGQFLAGAFLAGNQESASASYLAEDMFIQSAMGFALAERFSAAAMMRELARDIQIREGRPAHETRHREAEMWLAELKRGNEAEFGVIYPRALNAAQMEHPGSGVLEGIFEASTAHYLGLGDHKEAARAFLRTAWARVMKLTPPPVALNSSSGDWFRTAMDILTAGTFFTKTGQPTYASMAEKLSKEAYELGEDARKGLLEIIPSHEARPDEPTVNIRPRITGQRLTADQVAARFGEGTLVFRQPGDPDDERGDEVDGRPEDFDGQTTE